MSNESNESNKIEIIYKFKNKIIKFATDKKSMKFTRSLIFKIKIEDDNTGYIVIKPYEINENCVYGYFMKSTFEENRVLRGLIINYNQGNFSTLIYAKKLCLKIDKKHIFDFYSNIIWQKILLDEY